MASSPLVDRFVDHLESLNTAKDRGALAALRRGLGRAPGEAPEMFPHVVPWLPAHPTVEQEQAFYTVAALFSSHPSATSNGNMGNHLAASIGSDYDRAATERRIVALLGAHPDDLTNALRQAVSYLRSKEKPVNYRQLIRDLLAWGSPSRSVQRRWASGFWGQGAGQASQPDAPANKE